MVDIFAEVKRMAMYARFAALYDQLMDDVDYPAWAGYYLRLLARKRPLPKTLADAACGTGRMAIQFARKGIRVTASDLSEEMVAVAAENARKNGVIMACVRQDMRNLTLPRPVEAITACCDGVNYLTDMDKAAEFFAAAHRNLKPGGVLAFDISSRYKLEQILGDRFYGEDRDEVTYLWQNSYDAATRIVTMDLSFFVKEQDDLYRRFEEIHLQRAHDPEEITGALAVAGFSEIEVFGDRTFDPPTETSERLHFLAVKR